MTLTAMLIGLAINVFVQFLTKNDGKLTAWITPERTRTIQACVALLTITSGILVAAQTPGGLGALDWQHIINVVGESVVTIWVAVVALYVGLIKPLMSRLKEKEQSKL